MDQQAVYQPRLTDEEMKQFLMMYPYMADYPYDDIHVFWYNNIKNQGLSEEESDLDSEDKKKLDGEDRNELDDSRNSDLIKQELKRKRKRPKKKKNLNNDK
jgi:hypothetical protein